MHNLIKMCPCCKSPANANCAHGIKLISVMNDLPLNSAELCLFVCTFKVKIANNGLDVLNGIFLYVQAF